MYSEDGVPRLTEDALPVTPMYPGLRPTVVGFVSFQTDAKSKSSLRKSMHSRTREFSGNDNREKSSV